MKIETKRRIAKYKSLLPHMKERVIAATLTLAIAFTMGITASFAWVTLSRSPEVSAVATTLAANGALEIALSKDDGSEPSDADFDESVGISTDVTITNLRWGNLINISDASYGIDNLALRPAQLNTGALATSPLWGAVYGKDGRVEKLDSRYAYAKWDTEKDRFLVSSGKGVRAISSYTVEALDIGGADYAIFENKYNDVLNAHTDVGTTYYSGMTSNISGLGSTIGTYLQAKINETSYAAGDPNIQLSTAQVQSVLNAYNALFEAMEKENAALVKLANLQQYIYAKQNGADGVDLPYTEVTWNDIKTNQNKYDVSGSQHKANPTTPEEAISITGLKTYVTDYNTAVSDLALLESLVEKSNGGTAVYSKEIDVPVNHLVAPDYAALDGSPVGDLMNKVKSNPLSAFSYISGDHIVKLGNGMIKRFEQMATDSRLKESKSDKGNAAAVKATAKNIPLLSTVNIDVTGHLCTSASGASHFQSDFGKLPTEISQANKVAEDTYGMAVDFWVRSNHEGTYLTLEGATVIAEDGSVLEYNGKNRVWGATGNTALTTDSTTQGGGSCYIYYADTPEDMARSLDLLQSMKVAFVAQDGTLLATAAMDTEHHLPVNGRVTVPLVLSEIESEPYTATNEDGEEEIAYAIKHMKLDEKSMITAVIYLDGDTLQNDQVLAASDIEGQLNLQFCSSEKMTTVGNNKLLTAERYVTASVSKTEFNYDTAGDAADLTTTITVNVEGSNPQTVQAFFVRAVNNAQGKREKTISLTKQADGSWKGDYEFPLPGTYYLRYIRMDRVDYVLADPCVVQVDGFALASVNWGEGLVSEKSYYSTGNSFSESVAVQFLTTDVSRMPDTVQAKFIRDDGNAVTIDTKYNPTTKVWEGTGNFAASGSYTLSYLMLNGNYYDISQYAKELNLHLGLKAAVYNNNSPLHEDFDDEHPETVRNRDVQVSILDNSGKPLTGLTGLKLYYANGSNNANGKDTDLTWNETTGYYEGTLPLVKAGRYRFSSLVVGDNTITSVTESPTYVIAPPAAPEYDATSASLYNGDNVNFIPLKSNATMGPIRISNSVSAQIEAVLYNRTTGDYYNIDMASVQTEPGTMYYVNEDGGYWMINLPVYTDGNANIQDGTWQLACLRLWECYDGSTNENNYREDYEHAVVWLGNTPEATAYAVTEDLTVDQTMNFSKLTTTVSCTVNVAMTAGTTTLGDHNTEFMTQYPVKDLGMSIAITDNAGRAIPADKLGDVVLSVNYTANTDAATYGYEVSSAANKNYNIVMKQQTDGKWLPDSNYIWQYVGEYVVEDLKVAVAGTEKSFVAGRNGVPEKYTITTQSPTADNLEIKNVTQSNGTVFGKSSAPLLKAGSGSSSGGDVTGQFLASYAPAVNVSMNFSPLDVNNQMYAIVPGMSVTVDYTYLDGTTAPFGNYSWVGVTGFESYTDTVDTPTVNGSMYSFVAGNNKVLLAGRYKVEGTLHWLEGNKEKTKSIGALSNISVYSVSPSVTVTGISKTGEVTVNSNNSVLTEDASTFTGVNRFDEHFAVVYMEYGVSSQTAVCAFSCEGYWESDGSDANNGKGNAVIITERKRDNNYTDEYADYTVPEVTLRAADFGSYPLSLTIAGNGEHTNVQLGSAGTSVPIGYVDEQNDTSHVHQYYTSSSACDSEHTRECELLYVKETPHILGGAQTITTAISTVGSSTVTRQLKDSLTISQTNVESPKLTITDVDGMTLSVKDSGNVGVTSGSMVDGFTELTITATAKQGYYNPRITAPANAIDWAVVSEGETVSVYTCKMAFEDMSLSGTTEKYPAVTYAGSDVATVSVSAGGTSVASGVGVKPGSTVTVTLNARTGYYAPEIKDSGVTLTKTSGSTDYKTVYTFTMPAADVTLGAPEASRMRTVSWENTSAFSFQAVDVTEQSKSIASGDYVVPGHKVRITLTADGGTDPALTSPAGATLYSSANAFTRQYDFTMPDSDVTLAGTANPYPEVSYANDYADVTMASNGLTISTVGADAKGIKPDNTVTITLQAKPGYYAPRMTQPAGATNFQTVGTPDNQTATYSFTMPNSAVNAGSAVSATPAPTVTFAGSGATLSISARNYDGTAVTSGSGMKVQPRQEVTVTVNKSGNNYIPTVTATGAVLSERSPVGNGYDTATYTFTMGTENVTLTTAATAYPTLTISNSNTAITAKVGDTNQTASAQVRPGTSVTVSVASAANYYNPKVTTTDVTLSARNPALSQTSGDTSASYGSFAMPESNVTLTGSATIKPKVTISNSNTTITATVGSTTLENGSYVTPGDTVKVSVSSVSGYKNPKVQGSGGWTGSTTSNTSFTMPISNVTLTGNAEKEGGIDACITGDTLITMADGTQRAMDEIEPYEEVLVFNHEIGRFDSAPMGILVHKDSSQSIRQVMNLVFDDATEIKVIVHHGFFDTDINQYIYIDENNYADWIGHHFFRETCENGTYVSSSIALVDVYFTTERTTAFAPITKYHLNYFANGFLAMTSSMDGLFNIFALDETMKYDAVKMASDIEEYGLFSYDDFAPYIPYDLYRYFPAEYFKVSIGKGYLSFDHILELVEMYSIEDSFSKIGSDLPAALASAQSTGNSFRSLQKERAGAPVALPALSAGDFAGCFRCIDVTKFPPGFFREGTRPNSFQRQ